MANEQRDDVRQLNEVVSNVLTSRNRWDVAASGPCRPSNSVIHLPSLTTGVPAATINPA